MKVLIIEENTLKNVLMVYHDALVTLINDAENVVEIQMDSDELADVLKERFVEDGFDVRMKQHLPYLIISKKDRDIGYLKD